MIFCFLMAVKLYLGGKLFSSVCIFQGVLRLLVAGAGRADVGNHDCLAVPAQSIFQQSGELVVAVVCVRASGAERVDAVSQCQK